MKIRTLCILIGILAWTHSHAEATLSHEQQQIEEYVEKLDRINYLPTLLPLIINNSDVIELTEQQVETLMDWREKNREDVILVMNEIAHKRIEIQQAAVSPDVSAARIIQMQTEIFRLQRKVLEYKLSCRDLVMKTFNRTNWEGFFLVLAEEETALGMPDAYATK